MKAKKSLGQNFLKSEMAIKKIVGAGEIKKNELVLEIGPGRGALTQKLLESGARVLAVEKDRELVDLLKEKFAKEIKADSLVLVHEDILKLSVQKALSSFLNGLARGVNPREPEDLKKTSKIPSAYKLIANIPYNITGAVLRKFLTAENPPKQIVLVLQHDVVKRILDSKGSLLSIAVKAYGTPKMIMKIPARYFSPQPKVDSAVISIKDISRKTFTENGVNEEKFWQIVRSGFAHKRKKLASNLKKVIPQLPLKLKDKRAEDLTLMDWIRLATKA